MAPDLETMVLGPIHLAVVCRSLISRLDALSTKGVQVALSCTTYQVFKFASLFIRVVFFDSLIAFNRLIDGLNRLLIFFVSLLNHFQHERH